MSVEENWKLSFDLLRAEAGNPSLREIAAEVGFSHTHVSDIMRDGGAAWTKVVAVIETLGGNREDFRAMWETLRLGHEPLGQPRDVAATLLAVVADMRETLARIEQKLDQR